MMYNSKNIFLAFFSYIMFVAVLNEDKAIQNKLIRVDVSVATLT